MRKPAVLLATLMVLAACSGGGTTRATSQTIDPKVSDQLAANAAVLQASDLPGSFSSESSSSSSSSSAAPQVSLGANRCLTSATGQASSAPDNAPIATAEREYAIGLRLDAIIVAGRVEMYRDATAPASKLAAFGQTATTDCVKKFYVDQLTAVGATVGEVSVTGSKVDGFGDEQAGFLVSFVATIDAVDHPFAIEFDFTRNGRVGLTVSVVSPRGLDHSLAVTAMKAMAHRSSQ
jgi:hypothetical protein